MFIRTSEAISAVYVLESYRFIKKYFEIYNKLNNKIEILNTLWIEEIIPQ